MPIKIKRSAVAARIPTPSQLALGELAVNTHDGKLYLKKDDGAESIVEVGAGAGGGITYTRHTTTHTASANEGIIADTTSGGWTLTLPASPSVGDVVEVVDGGDWSASNLTVARNGATIEGDAENMMMDLGGVAVTFVYDGTTWQVFAHIGANSGDVLMADQTAKLTVGFKSAVYDNGTISSGALTPVVDNGNFQKAINGGAHALNPPSVGANEAATITLIYTNTATAGAVDLSNFTDAVGSFTATNGDDFIVRMEAINDGMTTFSFCTVEPLQ